jgi:hypothetical protein
MKKIVICLLIVVSATAFLSCYIASVRASSEGDIIDNATTAMNQAFNNVLAAETLGANVTTLLSRLNTAGQLLSQAQNSYYSGSTIDVARNAQNAYSIASQVNSQALSLKMLAENQTKSNNIQTIAFSSVGAIVFVLILLLIWRRVKSSYFKRLLDMKVEGVVDEH